ncbi:glycosyltransferase involved in cell wall biosynthesis [Haloferula luteola]|uniref:Glycosyltransferase involved in cell wall biosynthesis n=1 Tax=Haloferula luteola TaxID=595692 RepID=A0A840V193_9BACT|nr:glycosyltransferase family 2 protein [Haloferula luteola]MBB5350836.1 glycosyltransferase involved in cell wall biosynthesis [Haloferula luteola]
MSVSILILTKNEENDLPGCLESVGWSDDIHLFDSFSTDRTVEIAESFGAKITQRVFDNWSAHQNWGLANIDFKYPWVLYIDADERVSRGLRDAVLNGAKNDRVEAAFRLRRRDFYLDGTWLKHAQISPFYLRLFRPERMRYERLVNPVSVVDGEIGEIEGYLDHYPFSKGIGFWLERHIKYSNLEAQTIHENRINGARFSLWKAFFERDFTERRFHQKELFYRIPGRPFMKWFYMMFVRRAFLDGRAGVTYATLQSIYEYFITLRQRELSHAKRKPSDS